MRVAVIPDIHGNCIALDRVLEDLGRGPTDKIVCLGDAIQRRATAGGGREAAARLRRPVVMGNAVALLLTGKETGNEPTSEERQRILDAGREWSLHELSGEDREFVQGFQPTVEVALEGGAQITVLPRLAETLLTIFSYRTFLKMRSTSSLGNSMRTP